VVQDCPAFRVKLNLVSVIFLPGMVLTGYLGDEWSGVAMALLGWLATVLACTVFQHYRFRRRMPPGVHPTPSNAKHIWLDRFGVRLRQLQPSMNFPAAARVALVTWSEAADLEPEIAAEIYLRE
jgi:hypothetical protein